MPDEPRPLRLVKMLTHITENEPRIALIDMITADGTVHRYVVNYKVIGKIGVICTKTAEYMKERIKKPN